MFIRGQALSFVKQIYFFRHGEADWPDWDKPDDDRPLTKHGRKEVRRVARFLRHVGAKSQLIFTSPLVRAAQTAKIVADILCLELVVEASLGKGFNAEKLRDLVRAHDLDRIVIVGHEPDFSRVIAALTGGKVVLAKSGVALVEVNDIATSGKLRWLFPPRFAKRP